LIGLYLKMRGEFCQVCLGQQTWISLERVQKIIVTLVGPLPDSSASELPVLTGFLRMARWRLCAP
ncbi:hypothetical protein, partial [Pseudomonas viridiflava]|uniref:hypothetical protein n=1 Tax=Pseudomonas viridiflava TaxID=33069 RepID=UPI0019D06712